MKTVEEIAGMVTIRNHLQTLRDRSLIKRSDYQAINNLIQQLDQDIINASMTLFKQQSKVQIEDELNISKKIAEAKAKLRGAPTAKDTSNDASDVETVRPAFKKKAPKVTKTEVETKTDNE